jgi:hypothetical protein
LATVFWDSKGIILIDILPRGENITRIYYNGLLYKLRMLSGGKEGDGQQMEAYSFNKTMLAGHHQQVARDWSETPIISSVKFALKGKVSITPRKLCNKSNSGSM